MEMESVGAPKTMCKTCFDSEEMILFLNHFWKNVNGKRDSPSPLMENSIKNFDFVFQDPSLNIRKVILGILHWNGSGVGRLLVLGSNLEELKLLKTVPFCERVYL